MVVDKLQTVIEEYIEGRVRIEWDTAFGTQTEYFDVADLEITSGGDLQIGRDFYYIYNNALEQMDGLSLPETEGEGGYMFTTEFDENRITIVFEE